MNNYLKFDAEVFLRVVQGLFRGKAYGYLVKSQQSQQALCASPEQLLAGIAKVVANIPREPSLGLVNTLSNAVKETFLDDMDSKKQEYSVHYLFNLFLLRVVVDHFNYAKEMKQEHEK